MRDNWPVNMLQVRRNSTNKKILTSRATSTGSGGSSREVGGGRDSGGVGLLGDELLLVLFLHLLALALAEVHLLSSAALSACEEKEVDRQPIASE